MTELRRSCPICGGIDLRVFVERRGVPVHQNLPFETQDAARSCRRGDLLLASCERCTFVTNTAFRPELLEYGDRYENDQAWSPTFEQHVDMLVSRLVTSGLTDSLVAEVGCGNGRFLRELCARGNNRGIGFDPSYVGPAEADAGRVRFVQEYFGPGQQHGSPDAVVCRHVIEHVPAPLGLLATVRGALGDSERAVLCFETPDVEWILQGIVIQDFFYEHCSYFSAATLELAFRRAGFAVRSVERLFGSQYLWLEAGHASADDPRGDRREEEQHTHHLIAHYAAEESRRIARCRDAIGTLLRSGPVAVWGAGAKGVTFVNLLDPEGTAIDCVIDINPKKQGMFVPGSGHPIVQPAEVVGRGITSVVVMNPNYDSEIRGLLSSLGRSIAIHAEGDL